MKANKKEKMSMGKKMLIGYGIYLGVSAIYGLMKYNKIMKEIKEMDNEDRQQFWNTVDEINEEVRGGDKVEE